MTRGSTTPSLFVAQDGHEWVVKPSGRTLRDGLVEILCARLASRVGIPTPGEGIFEVGDGLLAAMGAMGGDIGALGEAFARGGRYAFGSRLSPGADWVGPAVPGPEERRLLGRIWVFDQWIANADRRPDNPNLILSGTRLLAIDHAQALPWLSGDSPRLSPHLRDASAGDPETLRGEQEMAAALHSLADAGRVRAALGRVPAAWASEDELDTLAEILASRIPGGGP